MEYNDPLTASPYLLPFRFIEFVIRWIPVAKLKSIIVKRKTLPVEAIRQVNVESIVRDVVGFTESTIRLTELS